MFSFDLAVPFFVPLWRRVAVVGFCVGWGCFEFVTGAPFWGILFLGAGVGSGWKFANTDWAKVAEAAAADAD